MINKNKFYFLFVVSQWTNAALATEVASYFSEQDLLVEIPVIAGVSHMEQRVSDTPTSVTIIDRRTIESSTATDLGDLFRLVPGFQAYFVNGNRYGVNYHALGDEYPRRLEVKIDGRSIYESLFSAVVWPTLGIDLSDIERIEIVRGSNAPADGSNAFLGSVNIITRSPLLENGWSLYSQIGSNATRNATLAYGGTLGDLAVRTTLQTRNNHGFAANSIIDNRDDLESEALNFTGVWTPHSSDEIRFGAGVSRSEVGLNESVEFFERNYEYNFQSIQWSHLFETGNKFELLFYRNDYRFDDKDSSPLISEFLSQQAGETVSPEAVLFLTGGRPDKRINLTGNDDVESERWDLELRTSYQPQDDLRAVSGIAARYDRVNSPFLFDTRKDLDEWSYRAYTNMEWMPHPRWVVNAGILGEDHSVTGSHLSSRLGANFKFTETSTMRAAFNRGYRAPTLLETFSKNLLRYDESLVLDAQIVADPDIEKEKLRSIEIGYNALFLDGTLSLDVKRFHEEIRDAIDVRSDPLPEDGEPLTLAVQTFLDNLTGEIWTLDDRVGVRTNGVRLDIRGLELEAEYRPSRKFQLRGVYTWLDPKGFRLRSTIPNASPKSDLADTSPHNAFAALANYTFDNQISLSLAYFRVGDTDYRGGDNIEGYDRVDFKIARDWQLPQSNLNLSFTVQNVADDYNEYVESNIFQTRYVLGLNLDLN